MPSKEAMAKLEPSFAMPGEFGFDAVAMLKYTTVEQINHVHTPGNSSGIVDGAAITLIGTKEIGEQLGLKTSCKNSSCSGYFIRSYYHANRPRILSP